METNVHHRVQVTDGVCRITAQSNADGEVEDAEFLAIREAIRRCLAQGIRHVQLDMSCVEFVSEQAVASLVTLWRLVQERDSRLVLSDATPVVTRKLNRMGMLPLLTA
jgi:anti-anti-sigma factor